MSMDDRDGVIWFDGELVPWREAKVHVLTHSLHYGMGVFEGMRAYKTDKGTAIFRLPEHIRRLYDSAQILGINIPYEPEQLTEVCKQVVRDNNLDEAYIRPIAFYGSEGMGLRADNLKVHVAIAAWEWGAYLGEEGMQKGIRIRTSSYTRLHININMCKAKATGHYINSTLALQEALSCGYDEALLLDAQGYVAEGSGENIFMVRDGKISTPLLTSALNGITRDSVIQLAGSLGMEVEERLITRDELYVADEVFFTGSAAEVTPIREYDNRVIGCGSRGPITGDLQSGFFDIVYGRNDKFGNWLTFV